MIANAAFGDDPGRWPLPAGTLRRGAVAPRGRRRRAGPLRKRLRRSRFRPAGTPRRAAGVAGAQHPGVLLASARLARQGARLGRPRARGGGRPIPKGTSRRADRSGRRRARRRQIRRLRGGAAAGTGFARRRARHGWPSGWRGCRPNWRWRPATARRRSAHAERAVELAGALGSARHRGEVRRRAGRGALQRWQARPVACGGRRRAGHHAATGTRPAELGVGVPARRRSAAGTTPLIKSLEFATLSADTVRRRGGVLQDR